MRGHQPDWLAIWLAAMRRECEEFPEGAWFEASVPSGGPELCPG